MSARDTRQAGNRIHDMKNIRDATDLINVTHPCREKNVVAARKKKPKRITGNKNIPCPMRRTVGRVAPNDGMRMKSSPRIPKLLWSEALHANRSPCE